ncbi:hypothetical protein GPX-Vietnam_042 [Goatpox virus]|uniref:Uncharacterized protein n=2 Tax=Goatpox virus TaxID=186805 RepID=A0A2Z4XFR6_9POXV|nr:hypothetical protein [Goatpox virus FZ]AXA19935.1 hypothetical protein [Goatpox virus]QEJ78741.1 hypothetical protein GPX-India_042 [Goatpox virus]QEJ78891.1 hypothetical protein GPX-Vietnam_042 [Goatpox virus]QOK36479.1 hypothetical protein [Goatpox virus]
MSPSYIYPKRARDALSKIISSSITIERFLNSNVFVDTILEFGFHGILPVSLYNRAIDFDINNLKYFPVESIRLDDLINLLLESNTIDSKLHNAVFVYRKDLITSRNGDRLIKLMIENDLLNIDDINYIVSESIVPNSYILKLNPMLVSNAMILSKDELIEVIKFTPSYTWKYLYKHLSIELDTLLYISDTLNVPPTNISLLKLNNMKKAIEIIKKYPNDDIITYVSSDIKLNLPFIEKIHEIVNNNFPKMLTHMNNFLFSTVSKEELIKRYGIKSVAMFSFNLELHPETISDDDKNFILENINIYESKCKNFFDFKKKFFYNQLKLYKPPSIIKSPSFKKNNNIDDEEKTIDDVLNYIDNLKRKILITEVEFLISPFKFNPCIVRNICLSNSSIKTKLLLLKIIKKWKYSYNLTNKNLFGIQSFKKINDIITFDMTNYIISVILCKYKKIYDRIKKLENLVNMNLICNCENCNNSKINHKSKNTYLSKKTSDDDIINCLYDLVNYAIHGLVNPSLIGIKGWGALSCLLNGTKKNKIDINIYNTMDFNFVSNNGDILLSGSYLVNKLIPITKTPLSSFVPFTCFSLNDYFSKTVILFNIILEYMISFVLYRIITIQRYNNLKEYISKVVNTCLEASGVFFTQINISNIIETEINDIVINGSFPVRLLNIFLKVITTILEEINGIS